MPLNIDWQQILLHLLNFVVLFAVLYFLVYKPVRQFMDKRAQQYKDFDDAAKRDLAEAEKAKEEYSRRLAAAEEEILARKREADAEIETEHAARRRLAEDEAARMLEAAKKEIENERAKMLREAQREITDMVVTATEKILAQSTTSQAFDQFLDGVQRGESDG